MPSDTATSVDLSRYFVPDATLAVGDWALDTATGFVDKVGETRQEYSELDGEDDKLHAVTDFFCSLDEASNYRALKGTLPDNRLAPIAENMTFFHGPVVFDAGLPSEATYSFRLVADDEAQAATIAEEAIYKIDGGGTWTMTSSRTSSVVADPDAFETLRAETSAPAP